MLFLDMVEIVRSVEALRDVAWSRGGVLSILVWHCKVVSSIFGPFDFFSTNELLA